MTIILAAGLALFKGVLLPALSAAVTVLIAQASAWVKAKTGSQAAATSLTVIDDLVGVVVKEMQQTQIVAIKAENNGRVPAESAAMVKAQAVAKIKDYLGTKGLEKMVHALKVDQSRAMELIESKVEAAVWHTKNGPPTPLQPSIRLAVPNLAPAGESPAGTRVDNL